MKTKILLLISIFVISGFSIGFNVFAQEADVNDAAVEEAITADENITADDLEVSEPSILPDSPIYPLKDFWRKVRVKLTFNPIKKAELQLQIANEKLIEAKKLAEKTGEGKVFQKTLEKYQQAMEKIRERVENFQEKAADNPKIDDFLNKYTNRIMLQQRLMDGLEKKFSDDPEKLQKMEQVREKVMENFGEIINKLEDKDKIADRLDKNLAEIEGGKYKNFKNLEVLLELENKVPEQAKDAIRRAQENALNRLHGDLNNMSQEDQERFGQYLEKIGGNQTLQLKAVEKLKEKESSNNVNKILNQIKEKVQQRVNTTKSENLPGKESGATICPMYWAPVCGKDNKTYSNIVCAKATGVGVAYSGECRVEGPIKRSGCKNLCGDGKCQQVVCMAIGCPCTETVATCPRDCSK